MELYQIVLLYFQITHVLSKKHDIPSSDESIENLLYYKGCQHSKNTEEIHTTQKPIEKLRAKTEPVNNCPFPKMCCSMTCGGNECESSHMTRQNQMFSSQNMNQHYPPIGPPDGQSPVQPQALRRKKKNRQPMMVPIQPPIGGRRDFGFTKDRIKNLINQDEDIRKILKDLVKVTMKKVDLVDMINKQKPARSSPPVLQQNTNAGNNNEDDDYYDDELE